MKKIITTLLALAMILSCVVVFSSCSLFAPKPELDLEDAKDNLEDADYSVSYEDDEDLLGPGVAEQLYAYDDDNFLRVTVYEDSKSASLAYDEIKMELDHEKESIKLTIKSIEHVLDKYEDDLEDEEIDELEDMLEEYQDELEEYEDYVIGKSGKTVWAGTKDAIEDSKG